MAGISKTNLHFNKLARKFMSRAALSTYQQIWALIWPLLWSNTKYIIIFLCFALTTVLFTWSWHDPALTWFRFQVCRPTLLLGVDLEIIIFISCSHVRPIVSSPACPWTISYFFLLISICNFQSDCFNYWIKMT